MAKRANPYADDFIPQSKTHVGLKQINNTEEKLKKVYEKTLDMLFKGANNKIKSTVESNNNHKDVEVVQPHQANGDSHGRGMKQLSFNKDGQLYFDKDIVIKDTRSHVEVCTACASSPHQSCLYCDVPTCLSCTHTCTLCAGAFCARCCFVECEFGNAVCISCYK